jgi:hypothetical protein
VAQFATNADLAVRLGVTLSAAEQTRADTLLQLASGVIQKEAKQTISQVANDVLTRPGSTDEVIRLPERPVVSVASVTLNGVAMVLDTDYVLISDMLVRLNSTVVSEDQFYVLYPDDGWGDPTQTLVVTYTHGWATVPDVIRAVCLEQAVRAWVNPGNVVEESYGPERVVYQPRSGTQGVAPGLLLTDDEKRMIHDAVRRTAGSIALR